MSWEREINRAVRLATRGLLKKQIKVELILSTRTRLNPLIRVHGALRKRILKRDNYECQECGCSKELKVHHKMPVILNGSNEEDNLITLCHTCHMGIHAQKYGFFDLGQINYRNNTGNHHQAHQDSAEAV